MIHSRVCGAGDPLVVLHGLFGSGENWTSYAREWGKNHTVYLADLPNHGQSGSLENGSFPAMARLLEDWRAREIQKPVTLLGHSLGGKAVMEWALAYPEAVEALVVVDMAPRQYDNRLNKIIQLLLETDLNRFPDRPSVRRYWEEHLGDQSLSAFLVKNITDEGGILGWRLRREHLWDSRERLWEALDSGRKFDGPALFVKGERSDYVGAEDMALIRELFPQAEVREVPKAGHWVQADNPEGFQKALAGYL